MPITSQWSFASLNRNRSTVLSGSAFLSTSAYSITRFRTSDDTYASQVGDAVQSLSGYNGGVTETITTPAIEGSRFATTQDWVSNSSVWVQSSSSYNGKPIYLQISGQPNLPDGDMVNVIYYTDTGVYETLYGAHTRKNRSVRWYCGEFSNEQVANSDFGVLPSNRGSGPSISDSWIPGWGNDNFPPADSYWDISPFGSYAASGTFSGSSVFTNGYSNNGYFVCMSDAQLYDPPSVPWYKQTQTWVFRGSF